MSYGSKPDYNFTTMTDQFLINLHQDWVLSDQLFGVGAKMVKAIERELRKRNLEPEEYGWEDPRLWEIKHNAD